MQVAATELAPRSVCRTERSRAGGAPGTLPGPPQHGATPAHEGAGHVGGMNGGDANGDAPAASGVELGAQYGAVYGAQYDPEDDDDDDDVPPPPPPPPPEVSASGAVRDFLICCTLCKDVSALGWFPFPPARPVTSVGSDA